MDNNNEALDAKFNEMTAKILKKYRKKSGLSLEEVVQKMENPITRQSLFKYENNLARIKNNTFADICKVYNLDPQKVIMEINYAVMNVAHKIHNETDETVEFPIINPSNGEKIYAYTNTPTNEEINKIIKSYDNFDELELLFDKNKNILTDRDKNIIKTIIEERKKEIDKELGEDE